MNKIKAVIFDMDGVIFDTERIYLEDWIKVFFKYGYIFKKEIYVNCMGRGRNKVKEIFKSTFGEDLPIEEMYIEKDRLLNEAVNSNRIPIKDGAIEILDFLREKGYKIALATSAKRERLEMQLKLANIKDKFDALVCGDDVNNNKPDPEIFLKASQKVGVDAKNCVVIEDSEAGIKAAYYAGMTGLHVEDLKVADDEILNYCYKNFKNLNEIKEYLSKSI